MATAALEVVLRINDTEGGWSEKYYFTIPSSFKAGQVADDLVNKRITVLGAGCTIVRATVGRTDQPRAKLNFRYARAGSAADLSGNDKGTIRRADQRDTTVLMPYRTAAGTLRYVAMGGYPDAWLDRNNTAEFMNITQVGKDSTDPMYDFLLSAPWQLLIRERLRADTFLATKVTAVAQHTDGRYLFTSTLAASLASGDKVVLTGLKGNNLANAKGTRKVVAKISDTTFTIDRGPRADLGVPSLSTDAKVSKVGYSYETAVATAEGYVLTTRKRGRAFAQRRGRRSASK